MPDGAIGKAAGSRAPTAEDRVNIPLPTGISHSGVIAGPIRFFDQPRYILE